MMEKESGRSEGPQFGSTWESITFGQKKRYFYSTYSIEDLDFDFVQVPEYHYWTYATKKTAGSKRRPSCR